MVGQFNNVRNIMAKQIVPNTNPDLMLGVWMEDECLSPELDVFPIIGFVFEGCSLSSVVSPVWPTGMSVENDQYRLYDKASGAVYRASGNIDGEATAYMREADCDG